jgi:hypothetical protein
MKKLIHLCIQTFLALSPQKHVFGLRAMVKLAIKKASRPWFSGSQQEHVLVLPQKDVAVFVFGDCWIFLLLLN